MFSVIRGLYVENVSLLSAFVVAPVGELRTSTNLKILYVYSLPGRNNVIPRDGACILCTGIAFALVSLEKK